MNKEELKTSICSAIDSVVSDDRELDGDDLDAVQTACEHVVNVATEVIDEDADEADALQAVADAQTKADFSQLPSQSEK